MNERYSEDSGNWNTPKLENGSIQPVIRPIELADFNASIEKLNFSVSKLTSLFEVASKELESGEIDGRLTKIDAQLERLGSSIISASNMIRDQQIQLNQLNLLFKMIQERLDEMRLQRRPQSVFKIPPNISEMQKNDYEESHEVVHSSNVPSQTRDEDAIKEQLLSDIPPPPVPSKKNILSVFKK